jgi:hypothetical protein
MTKLDMYMDKMGVCPILRKEGILPSKMKQYEIIKERWL